MFKKRDRQRSVTILEDGTIRCAMCGSLTRLLSVDRCLLGHRVSVSNPEAFADSGVVAPSMPTDDYEGLFDAFAPVEAPDAPAAAVVEQPEAPVAAIIEPPTAAAVPVAEAPDAATPQAPEWDFDDLVTWHDPAEQRSSLDV